MVKTALIVCAFAVSSMAQTLSYCNKFTVVTEDVLGNIKQGLSVDNAKWFNAKMAKKYPGVCYVDPTAANDVVFYVAVKPAVYNGTRIETEQSTHNEPITATVSDGRGNMSTVTGNQQVTTTTATAVPYSLDYGIFTLTIETKRPDGSYKALQRFQQKGLYRTLYGVPMGGRGHHPLRAVVEDAVKWVHAGGLVDANQGMVGK